MKMMLKVLMKMLCRILSQLEVKHTHQFPKLQQRLKTSPFLDLCFDFKQGFGSILFWWGSGSSDLYRKNIAPDADPTLLRQLQIFSPQSLKVKIFQLLFSSEFFLQIIFLLKVLKLLKFIFFLNFIPWTWHNYAFLNFFDRIHSLNWPFTISEKLEGALMATIVVIIGTSFHLPKMS